jgi:predicted GNAT family acetyltransferase
MKVDLDSVELYINYQANRIEARVQDYLCLVDFIPAERVIVFTHTEVPLILGGNGIAGLMVRAALAHVRENNLWLVPLCPYFSTYLRRHPEEQDLVYSWSPKSTKI